MSVIGAPFCRCSLLCLLSPLASWLWPSILWSLRHFAPIAINWCPLDDSERYTGFWFCNADCEFRRHWLLTFTYSLAIRLWCDWCCAVAVDALAPDFVDNNLLLFSSCCCCCCCCSWCDCLLVACIDFDIARVFDDWYTIFNNQTRIRTSNINHNSTIQFIEFRIFGFFSIYFPADEIMIEREELDL